MPSTDGLHAAGVDLDAIVADTNELQTNQGDWATATGFSTFDPTTDDVAVVNLVDVCTTNTDLTDVPANVLLALKLLRNKVETNPATGVMTVYDDNGSTPLYTANVYEDVAGTTPFDGGGANRRDRLA